MFYYYLTYKELKRLAVKAKHRALQSYYLTYKELKPKIWKFFSLLMRLTYYLTYKELKRVHKERGAFCAALTI